MAGSDRGNALQFCGPGISSRGLVLAAMIKVVLAAFILAASALTAAAQTHSGKVTIASDVGKVVSPAVQTGTMGAVLAKSFQVLYGGKVRASWQYKSDGMQNANTYVEVDGLGVICGQQTTSAIYVTFSCDLPVWPGAMVRIVVGSNSQPVWLRNAKLSFDIVEMTKPAVAMQ